MIPFALLVVSSALLFLSLVETAFGMLMRLPERLEAERENEGAGLATYLEDPLKFFVPVRLLRGLLLVTAVVLMAQLYGDGVTAGLLLLASGLALPIVVGQVLPALIVRRRPERYLELFLPSFTAVANLLAPFTARVIGWLGPVERGRREEAGNGGAEESTPATADEEAAADESALLRSVVDFGDTLVREVMTPRPDLVAIPATATVDDLRRLIREQEYSRLPVYTDSLDNIVGLIVVKDLIHMDQAPDGSRPVIEIMRPAAFVPETKRVADLLREFQQERFQLAIVVDEYGGTAGLVTIEDVVEELVGEIRDEYDSEAEPVVREDDDTYVFSAKVDTGTMAERLGVSIDEDGFETVGGYVLARVGRVPAAGERFAFDGLDVEVVEAEGRRIHKVRVRRLPDVSAGIGA
ncbi:MAG TPA: hemolysin family protein [Vicinamibacterales bacterium]|nr:hemolysin family protein [Vicinamibacterales bacterium]